MPSACTPSTTPSGSATGRSPSGTTGSCRPPTSSSTRCGRSWWSPPTSSTRCGAGPAGRVSAPGQPGRLGAWFSGNPCWLVWALLFPVVLTVTCPGVSCQGHSWFHRAGTAGRFTLRPGQAGVAGTASPRVSHVGACLSLSRSLFPSLPSLSLKKILKTKRKLFPDEDKKKMTPNCGTTGGEVSPSQRTLPWGAFSG